MQSYYYYERDSKRRPIVTHCLVFDGNKVAKGVAKCSAKDSPCKRTGRHISLQRAEQALKNKCSQMDKGGVFWKKLFSAKVFENATYTDEKIFKKIA